MLACLIAEAMSVPIIQVYSLSDSSETFAVAEGNDTITGSMGEDSLMGGVTSTPSNMNE